MRDDDFLTEEPTVVEPTPSDAELLEQLRRGVTRPIRVRAKTDMTCEAQS